MLLSEFIRELSRLSFILLAAVAAWDLVQHRDRTRLDIFLLFGTLAFSTLVSEIARLTGAVLPPWWTRVSTMLIMLQPFLLVRLVDHFRPVARRIQMINLIGLGISAVLLVVGSPQPNTTGGSSYPPWVTLPLVVYFVWAEAYAVFAFVQGARASGGPTRWRQALAAAGSAELGGLIALAGVGILFPSFATFVAPLNQILALLSGIAYYLAFAPPRWLRSTWQTNELYAFLREFAGKDTQARATEILPYLCQAATRVVGGRASYVALWDEANHTLVVQAGDKAGSLGDALFPETGPIRRAWDERKPQIGKRASLSPEGLELADKAGASVLVAVPIQTAERAWGVLITLMQRPPVFPQDDLALLALYTEQTALALEQLHLLDEQKAFVERLRQRGEQLEAANRELEAFSYSVSHDLRSPLRHIEGFTDLLLRGATTDGQQHQLQRISEAAVRMGGLIDDLLAFSRMSRADLISMPVQLDQLVADAWRDLQGEVENRQIEWRFLPLPAVRGDPNLLRMVLTNLLSNAIKYSRDRTPAKLEVGAIPAAGNEVTIYVKDNGVGFDMQYADKLFGVFQRLHHSDEFEGVGIGLATVRRIVNRHGGRTWAEAVPGQGAVFYFTLPALQPGANSPAGEQVETKAYA